MYLFVEQVYTCLNDLILKGVVKQCDISRAFMKMSSERRGSLNRRGAIHLCIVSQSNNSIVNEHYFEEARCLIQKNLFEEEENMTRALIILVICLVIQGTAADLKSKRKLETKNAFLGNFSWNDSKDKNVEILLVIDPTAKDSFVVSIT